MRNSYIELFFVSCIFFVCFISHALGQVAPFTVSGNVYVDHDNNAILDGLDYGHPVITVLVFEDGAPANGIFDPGETLYGSDVTDVNGDFSVTTTGSTPSAPATFTVTIDPSDLVAGATISNGPLALTAGDYTGLELSFQGANVVCYTVSDDDSPDNLVVLNRESGTHEFLGTGLAVGVDDVETISFDIGANSLYAINGDRLGTIDVKTGLWTGAVDTLGIGQHPTLGNLAFEDADGMSFDPFSGDLYATCRVVGSADVLFKINTTTGKHVDGAFGVGQDYLVLSGTGLSLDVDDIAISPIDGKMLGINNDDGSNDVLVEINTITGVMTSLGAITDGASAGAASPLMDVEGFGFTNSGLLVATTGVDGATGLANAAFTIDATTAQATLITNFSIGGDYEACDCLTQKENILSGTVFFDTDKNGAQSGASETGVGGVKVYVYIDNDSDGVVTPGDTKIDSVVTDVNGFYTWETASDLDFAITLDTSTFPPLYGYSTDSKEDAGFLGGFGGQTDPGNNFGIAAVTFPIELLSLAVEQESLGANLNWITSSEINSDFFSVERSLDPIGFQNPEELGRVKAAGFSSKDVAYSFYDRDVMLTGVDRAYYRLRTVDLDGTYAYSHIVELTLTRNNRFSVRAYPNPVAGQKSITIDYVSERSGRVEYQLISMAGQLIAGGESPFAEAAGSIEVSTKDLTPGIYVIRLTNESSTQIIKLNVLSE